jgi:hypothetical protein
MKLSISTAILTFVWAFDLLMMFDQGQQIHQISLKIGGFGWI